MNTDEKLMNTIDKLKKIDIKEIEKVTHIETLYLKAILNKDVEVLSKLNVTRLKGFLKILEREYKIDLDEYKNEFIETKLGYHDENLNSQGEKEYFLYADDEEPKSKNFYLLVFLLFILIVGYYMINSQKEDNKEIISLEKNFTNGIEDENVEKLMKAEEMVEENIKEINNSTYALSVDLNNSIVENNATAEDNKTTQNINKVEKIVIESTSKKIWLGIVYLDDYSKKEIIDRNITIDTKREQLIVTGHGKFKLHKNDNVEVFNGKKVRFLYKDNNLTRINNKMFKEYNKGKSW